MINQTNLLNFYNKQQTGTPPDKPTKASIFYINDLHGQDINMEKLINAVNQFDSFEKNNDKMKFASGDITIGANSLIATVANKFLNSAGFLASALGNHECDNPNAFKSFANGKKFNILALNVNPAKDNFTYGLIDKSYIQNINGNQYGIIGLAPSDMPKHLKVPKNVENLNIKDFQNTISAVQAEIDKFLKQGVNKIILLSHSGYYNDIKLAQNLNGVDVILGAHTHHLLKGIKENKNLFFSKSGEPVIITQAGKDGKNFGILNLEFDKNGVITKAQNNIGNTDNYNRNLAAKYAFEEILGKSKIVGTLTSVMPAPKDVLASENPQANFLMDALRKKTNADAALLNSTGIRGNLEEGPLDTRALDKISPWGNKIVIANISEKKLVETINKISEKTMQNNLHSPGLLQTSGIRYEITDKGKLQRLSLVNNDGVETKIDITNPNPNKFYKIVTDDFCAPNGISGLGLSPDSIQVTDYTISDVITEYLKSHNGKAEIKTDGRIKIVPSKGINFTGNTETSIFYLNDLHGKLNNMERIGSISKQFDEKETNADKLKLASGDILLGSNLLKNKASANFLNWIGVTGNALGNHEMDCTPADLSKALKGTNFNLLAINAVVSPTSPIYGKIQPSMIEEHNGEKYGIIGIAPPDALERVGTRESLNDITIDDINTTINKVQQEVNRLKSQGINKIILLSHVGYENDKRIAQETSGIDVILGGHSHNKIQGAEDNKNIFLSKSNEPVVITQAGKDGEYAGILNLTFDTNGIIKKVQNNVIKSGNFSRTLPYKYAIENIIGKPTVLGEVSYADPGPKNRLIEANAHGNFIVDAMKHELKTDIALLNAANLRGDFPTGKVDSRKIDEITPFEDKMMITELTEKQIVDAIKVGGKSFSKTDKKPGIILVSGLEYTMNNKGELLDMKYIDKNGQKIKIDVNNPSTTKKYTVAMDDFMAYGGDYYLPVNPNPSYVIKKFDKDKNVYTANYIKNLQQPFEIRDDGRIKIVNA